jgi:hypothetical protein
VTARRLLVLLLLATCALVGPGSPASAQAAGVTVEDGWWWSLQPDPPVLPSPPNVPEDGLRVSSSPSGEQSVTAVGVLSGQAQAQSVTLRVASQRGLTDDALAAFPTTTTFEDGTRAGPGAQAPTPVDGAAPLPVLVDVDAGTVTVDLLGLAPGGAFLLQPAVTAGELPRDLDVAFEAVRPEDVTLASAGPPSSGVGTLPPPAAPAPLLPAEAAPEGQDGFTLPSAPLAAEAPSLPGLEPQPAPAPAPAVAPPAGLLPDPLAGARPVVPSSAVTEAVTRSRTLGLLAVGLAAGLVLLQQGRPRRARLSLHGLPAPGAAPPAPSTRVRPPRLR